MIYILLMIVSLILGIEDGDCTVFVILALFGAIKAVTEGIELLRSKKNRKTKKVSCAG